MPDFYSQNRCVCSMRSHGPLLCAFCLSFHFNCIILNSLTSRDMSVVSLAHLCEPGGRVTNGRTVLRRK